MVPLKQPPPLYRKPQEEGWRPRGDGGGDLARPEEEGDVGGGKEQAGLVHARWKQRLWRQ